MARHNVFEDSLRGSLPLAEASTFFLAVKGTCREDRALAKVAFDAFASTAPPAGYLQSESEAAAAEEQNAAAFYREKTRQISEQLTAEQQQGAERETELENLRTQLAQADSLGQQYQHLVSDATERAVRAQDEVLQEQQTAAALRMAYQQLRGQLLQAASQEPPTTQALADMASVQGPAPMGAPATNGGAASAATPSTQTSQVSPAEGPAGQAPSPPAPPNSPNPEGDGDVHERSEPSSSNGEPRRTTQVSIKQGALSAALSRLAPAVVGAGIGGALSAHRPDMGALRDKIERLQAAGGADTLAEALDLAQSKMRLAFGELQDSHPRAAILGGIGVGGAMGAASGPGIAEDIRRTADALRRAKQV